MSKYCRDHEIHFDSVSAFKRHREKECSDMLKIPNICTYIKNGKCCKSAYNHVSSLIIHYYSRHKLYACARCYGAFESRAELESHEHSKGMNLRESKKSSVVNKK